MAQKKFDLFTYQLSPLTTTVQLDVFGETYTLPELIKAKNEIFNSIFQNNIPFVRNYNKLSYKVEYNDEDLILIRLANKKRLSFEIDFHRTVFDTQPSCIIIIYNNPEIQTVAVETDKTAFDSSFVVVNILQRAFDRFLRKYNLGFYIQPMYEEKLLWNLFSKYEGRIEKLQFEFSKPNLGRVNESLSEELKEIGKGLNSAKTRVEFDAPDNQTLENLNENNSTLNDLVHASAEGAGPAKIKLKGLRQWETTANKVKSIEIDELEIDTDSNSIGKYVQLIKDILKGE